MSKNLKKIMVAGAALLMFTSVGASASNVNVSARHVRSHRMARVNHQRRNQRANKQLNRQKNNSKRVNKNKSSKRARQNKRWAKHFNKKQRAVKNHKRQAKRLAKRANTKKRRNYRHAKKNNRILRSKFRRSNNSKSLTQSGFYDLRAFGPDIMNKYAPNNRKAVIPKNLNINDVLWLKGRFLQKNPTVYQYKPARHGWIQL